MCECLPQFLLTGSYIDGKLVKGDVDDIGAYWTDDSVAFLSKHLPASDVLPSHADNQSDAPSRSSTL